MRFIDEVDISVKAGAGAKGCRSFLREPYNPRGGPDGGDGGDGGDIILVANGKRTTLLDLHLNRFYSAESGKPGRGKNQHGKRGRDLEIHVPAGTVVRDAETSALLKDLRVHAERFIVAKGGKGGRGNARFVTSTQKAPDFAERGTTGEQKRLCIELKLLADVGIVGLPNAGKSTLIARTSSARPKIAGYPFTTLVPHLGVVRLRGEGAFVMADIPGIIEGASQGSGLGLRFLRHVERASLLLYLIDIADMAVADPLATYRVLRKELQQFNPGLLEKKQVLAFNKIDAPGAKERRSFLEKEIDALPLPVFFVSALTGEGLAGLMAHLGRMVEASRRQSEITL